MRLNSLRQDADTSEGLYARRVNCRRRPREAAAATILVCVDDDVSRATLSSADVELGEQIVARIPLRRRVCAAGIATHRDGFLLHDPGKSAYPMRRRQRTTGRIVEQLRPKSGSVRSAWVPERSSTREVVRAFFSLVDELYAAA
jgi:hypothetical protein